MSLEAAHGDVSAAVQTRLELFRPLSWDSSVGTSAISTIRASRGEKSMGGSLLATLLLTEVLRYKDGL